MKRTHWLFLLLVLAMVCSLGVGCGAGSSSSAKPADDDSSPADDDASPVDDDDNDDAVDDDAADDDASPVDDDDNDDAVDDDMADDDASPVDDDASPDDDDDVVPNCTVGQDFSLTCGDVRLELLDGGAIGEDGTSVAVGPDGAIHVLTTKTKFLVHYVSAGKGWSHEILGAFDHYPQLAVDAAGALHACFVEALDPNSGPARLIYQTNASGQWVRTELAEGSVFSPPVMAIDPAGDIHVLYGLANADDVYSVTYAVRRTGVWSQEPVSALSAAPYSLAVDSAGKAHIGYVRLLQFGTIMPFQFAVAIHLTNRSGEWAATTLFVGESTINIFVCPSYIVDTQTQLAVDSADHVHFVSQYCTTGCVSPEVNCEMDYAYFDGANWIKPGGAAGDAAEDYVVTADAKNQPHVFIADGRGVRQADPSGGNFVDEYLDHHSAASISAAPLANGKLAAAYVDQKKHQLKAAVGEPGSWQISTVDTGGIRGAQSSLAVAPDNRLLIGYLDQVAGSLNLETRAAQQWTKTTIAQTGENCAVKYGADGALHVAFSDGQVKYGVQTAGGWNIETVDSGDAANVFLDLDAAGFAHVLWRDASGILYYAENNSGAWVKDPLTDLNAMICNAPGLAVDAGGAPHISCEGYDSTINPIIVELIYATKTDGGWTTQTAWSGDEGIFGTALAFDGAGHPHLAALIYGLYGVEVQHFTLSNGHWTGETIATVQLTGDSYGAAVALTAGVGEALHLGYYYNAATAASERGLMYATDASGAWQNKQIDPIDSPQTASESIGIDSGNMIHLAYQSDDGLWHTVFPAGAAGRAKPR